MENEATGYVLSAGVCLLLAIGVASQIDWDDWSRQHGYPAWQEGDRLGAALKPEPVEDSYYGSANKPFRR